MRIAIQGQRGSYHQAAAENYFGKAIELIHCDTFDKVFETLKKKAAGAAVIASENSIAGTAHPVYDLLLKYDFFVSGEVYEQIHHCLIGFQGTKIDDIKRVYSQAIALPQCSIFLDTELPNADRIEYSDTAASVELINKLRNHTYAAIGSQAAAILNKAEILASNIENFDNNVTRFLILSAEKPTDVSKTDKASLVLETAHAPGALWHALGVFAKDGANLTKLESRPLAHTPWRYQFLIDVETTPRQLESCMSKLEKQSCTVRLLGQYEASHKSVF